MLKLRFAILNFTAFGLLSACGVQYSFTPIVSESIDISGTGSPLAPAEVIKVFSEHDFHLVPEIQHDTLKSYISSQKNYDLRVSFLYDPSFDQINILVFPRHFLESEKSKDIKNRVEKIVVKLENRDY